MKITDREYELTGTGIDSASQTVYEYLTKKGVEGREALKIRLNVENVLIGWLEHEREAGSFFLSCSSGMGAETVVLSCKGPGYNPFEAEEGGEGQWISSMRHILESTPVYRYVNNINYVRFSVKSGYRSKVAEVLLFLLAGILIGLIGTLFPVAIRESVCSKLLTPVYETYLAVFSLCGIPLIFLSLVTGILGVGDIHSFSRIGTGMILRFILSSVAVALIALLISFHIFDLNYGSGFAGVDYGSLVNMVLGWIPTNLLQPFIDCNAMQLIILGALCGIGILVFNYDTPYLVGTLNDVNRLLLKAMSWIASLIPVFVAIMVVNSIWNSTISSVLTVWRPWIITTAIQLLIMLVFILIPVIRYRVRIAAVIRKLSHTFIVALGTNSCTASIPENYRCCASELGIDSKVFTFGITLGTTVFKPATAVRLVVLCLFLAEQQTLTISAGWIIMLVIMAVMLSVAAPAIPGGTLMFCPLLFAQMEIPAEIIAQVLTTDVFFDCICTAFNQTAVELSLTSYAGSIGLLDKDTLRRE